MLFHIVCIHLKELRRAGKQLLPGKVGVAVPNSL